MAVKTEFTVRDIEAMLSGYALGALLEFAPIESGSVQTNYKLRTDSGTYVLRYYENRRFEQVQFELELLKKLQSEGFPCAACIQPVTGGLCTYRDKPYTVFEFVEGEHIEHPNAAQAEDLIRLIARLGKSTRGLKLPHAEARLTYNKVTLEKLARETAEKLGTDEGFKKLEWYLAELQKLELSETMTTGVCHCDFYFTNILYRGDEVRALLDFDDANETYLFFDIVSFIDFFVPGFNHETWSGFEKDAEILDFALAKKVLRVFEQVLEIPQTDKKHLYDILKLGILTDCIWYYARGNADDFFERRKISALNKMGREEFYNRLFCK